MSNQLVITSGAKVRSLEGVITGSTGVLNSLPINGANGIPQLDSNGKILVSQLPNSVMEYKGTWDAATNTPTLANGTGNQGDVYLCNVAGTVNFGAGPITFYVGDQVIYSGSIWQRASGASGTVTSVAITESGDALTITGSPITTSGTINIGFAGTSAQYVAGDGSLITFPALTGYVPYTGATSDVDLGTFSLNAKSLHIKGVGGNGHLGLKHQSANPTGSANESLLFADVNGNFGWQNDNLYLTTLSTHANTANRTYTFPNVSGTVALNNIDNVFTAEQTFSAPIDLNNALNLGFNIAGVGIGSSQLGLYATKASTTSNLTMYDGDTGFYARFAFNNTSNKIYTLPSTSGTLALTSDIPSLSATAPISYSSGVISISQATTSTNGYLSSTDWNTFNNKQNALTNPVIGTGALYQVSYFNGVSSISGSNNLKFDGINLSIGNPSSALAQLHVYNASAAASILLQTNSTTDYSEIAVRNDSSTATSYFRQYSTAATGSDFGISRAGLALFFSNYATNFAIGTRNGGNLIFGTADTERARIDTSGNFGIGTASPSYKLDVNGTGRFSADVTLSGASGNRTLNIQTNTSGDAILALTAAGSDGGSITYKRSTSELIFGNSSATSSLKIASTGAATFSSSVTANGVVVLGSNSSASPFALGTSTARFQLMNGGVYGLAGDVLTNGNTYLQSQRTDGNTAAYNLLLQPLGGNVGIGTSSPQTLLSVETSGTQNTVSPIITSQSTGTTYTGLYSIRDGAGDQRGMIFQVYTANVGLNEKMRITSSGNVGIGTSSPNLTTTNRTVLDINGTSTSLIALSSGGTYKSYIFNDGTDITYYSTGSTYINSASSTIFKISGTVEAMRITSGGDLRFGNTGQNGQFIYGNSNEGYLSISGGEAAGTTYGANITLVSNSRGGLNLRGELSLSAGNTGGTGSYINFLTNGTERMRITSGGNVCIGTTTVNDKLTIDGGIRSIGSSAGYFWNDRSNSANFYGWYATSNVVYFFNGSANAASITPSTGVYTPLSDINKKKDFEDSEIGLNAILGLKPTLFRMKDEEDTEKHLGFIAQQVKEFIPQAYVEEGEFIGLQDRPIIAALVKAIQEQQKQIEELKAKIK